MRRQKGEQSFMDLTASDGLSPRQDVLKRVDRELNAPVRKPLAEQCSEGAP